MPETRTVRRSREGQILEGGRAKSSTRCETQCLGGGIEQEHTGSVHFELGEGLLKGYIERQAQIETPADGTVYGAQGRQALQLPPVVANQGYA